MEVINNKLHLSAADYDYLCAKIESLADETVGNNLVDFHTACDDDLATVELAIRAHLSYETHRNGDRYLPNEGGELKEIFISRVCVSGWIEEGAIDVVFDPVKLSGELIKVGRIS